MTNKSNFQKIEFYSVEVIKRYEKYAKGVHSSSEEADDTREVET